MSTYSPDLRIELITTGDQAGTWGATTNTNLAYVVEQAIAGYVSVAVASANQAFTYINGGSSTAADNQAVHAAIALTTSTGANFAVYAPPASKLYTIYNASSYVATIYNSTVIGNTTAAGTGVAIPAGKVMAVWSDGTNFAVQNSHIIGTVVGNVTGNLTGNVTGNVTGDVSGNAGTVTNGVYTTGTQTIGGTKTFSSAIVGSVSGSSGSVATTNWTIAESGGKLVFSYGGTAKFSIDSSGNLIATSDITAYGTP